MRRHRVSDQSGLLPQWGAPAVRWYSRAHLRDSRSHADHTVPDRLAVWERCSPRFWLGPDGEDHTDTHPPLLAPSASLKERHHHWRYSHSLHFASNRGDSAYQAMARLLLDATRRCP